MSKSVSVSSPSSFPFFSILTLIFITLKLTGVIGWSWWWVLSPLLLGAAVTIFFLLVGAIVLAIVGAKRW